MHTAYMCSARTTTGQRRPTWSSALWRWHRSSRSSSGAVRMASWHGGGYCWWWMVWESTSLHSHISHGGNGWKWNVWNFSASCASSFHLCRVLWAIAGCTSSDLLETWENSVIHFDSTLHHASIVDSGLQHWQLVWNGVLECIRIECMTISCNLMSWWHIMAVNCSIPCHPCWCVFSDLRPLWPKGQKSCSKRSCQRRLIRVANISSAFGIWDLTPTGNMW